MRNDEYLSLSDLVNVTRVYEELPVKLRRTIWIVLGLDLATLIAFLTIPDSIWYIRVEPGWWFPLIADLSVTAMNTIMEIVRSLIPVLVVVSLLNLLVTLFILTVSLLTLRPASEAIHWLAWIGVVTAVINLVALLLMASALLIILLINIGLWALVVMVIIGFVIGLLRRR
jgi:hypothetical protein